jgi:PAS domain S-box-containing protein
MTDDRGAPMVPRAVEAGPELAFVCDEHGSILDANPAAASLLGEPVQAMRGRPLAHLAIPRDGETVAAGLAEVRRAGASRFSVQLRTAAGSLPPVEFAAWSFELAGARLTLCAALASGTARRQAEERARRLADTQKVISTILELALEEHPLEDLLQRVLDLVLWIPWLSIERKGAILLVEDDPNTLVMRASRGLGAPLLSTCGQVPFGACLCGQAAASRVPVYAAQLDERHPRSYPGMQPHGHYCVPICSGGAALGVINTYLVAGHEASAIDLEFLMAVADTLAGVIVRRRVAAECDALRRRLDELLRRGPLDATVADAALKLEDLMRVFLGSAQELLSHLPPTDRLRAAAEEIEQAAQRGMGLASELQSSRRQAK